MLRLWVGLSALAQPRPAKDGQPYLASEDGFFPPPATWGCHPPPETVSLCSTEPLGLSASHAFAAPPRHFVYFVYCHPCIPQSCPMSAQPYRYRQSKAPLLSVEERAAVTTLASRAKATGPLRIQVGKGAPIIVPKALHAQIFAVLTLAAEGTPSAVDRLTLTLTTQQVAERLGVSRPHVVSLIESRKLVGTKVGTHRRVLLADLEAYQSRQAASRSKALTSLVRQTRKLGLGY